jgi:hypothetical protein
MIFLIKNDLKEIILMNKRKYLFAPFLIIATLIGQDESKKKVPF